MVKLQCLQVYVPEKYGQVTKSTDLCSREIWSSYNVYRSMFQRNMVKLQSLQIYVPNKAMSTGLCSKQSNVYRSMFQTKQCLQVYVPNKDSCT
ncbi:hypothetical protein DPMN_111258 [Dreissena polymorpha]|uniref:Uncharacterized protein n=1 Tax=Dreissena polymorpha TaxID=45954 RepID=A0A9D4QNM8_DREPO|nr:hypothetical protein DPMN_111258 [Dreissena polymorpha]